MCGVLEFTRPFAARVVIAAKCAYHGCYLPGYQLPLVLCGMRSVFGCLGTSASCAVLALLGCGCCRCRIRTPRDLAPDVASAFPGAGSARVALESASHLCGYVITKIKYFCCPGCA